MKEYKTFSEFYAEMAKMVHFCQINQHVFAWFFRQSNGKVQIEITFSAAFGAFRQTLFVKEDCHPQFAWGIYQLLSNPAFLER